MPIVVCVYRITMIGSSLWIDSTSCTSWFSSHCRRIGWRETLQGFRLDSAPIIHRFPTVIHWHYSGYIIIRWVIQNGCANFRRCSVKWFKLGAIGLWFQIETQGPATTTKAAPTSSTCTAASVCGLSTWGPEMIKIAMASNRKGRKRLELQSNSRRAEVGV